MAMTTKQAAEKWGISDRRVRTLCVNGQIDGAWREGKLWFVPDNAPKPADGRIRGKETLLAQIERVAKLLLEDADVILSEETDERLDRLMLLIEDLEPPIRQLIFRLRYLQEKSYQEVADEVGVSKVTVFNHLSKAMDWIKEQFK